MFSFCPAPFIWLAFLLVFFSSLLPGFSQTGRLLLVGGGSEKNGASSWSTPAYKWAGQGKKVAIVGISTGSLAPYFMQQCGAARAKEFAIATYDSANSQATYDTLTSYDVIFFRGGDQYDYYSLYRNTKLQDAVSFLYSHGGTICGTSAGMNILSSIVYTAKNGSAYPDECIENPNNKYITLANDFMDLVPGFVFDTHFAERGRFARLVGFLANYSLNQGQAITGLGMDDMTCMTIDENGLGTVYGTGCANIYKSGAAYSQNGTKLLADTIQVVQLLHGCTYDFATGIARFSGLNQQISTALLKETGNYTILASGSDLLANNLTMLTDLVQTTGKASGAILLLAGDQTLATSFSNKLLELGAPQVLIYKPDLQSGSDADLGNHIKQSGKIMFLKNSYPDFSAFLGTPNGDLLQQRVKSDSMVTAFVGDNARFAGKTVVENYLTEYASYYGELLFLKGLSLLRYSVIMPNTYLNSNMYENSATAVPYAMLRDTLKYGIWLTNHNYMKYRPVEGKAMLTGFGSAPVMVISNAGSLAGFSSHTASGSTSTPPRMVAGFDYLQLSLIDETTPYFMGTIQPTGIVGQNRKPLLALSPNPALDLLTVSFQKQDSDWRLFDLAGRLLLHGAAAGSSGQIDVSNLKPGLYFLRVNGREAGMERDARFVKR